MVSVAPAVQATTLSPEPTGGNLGRLSRSWSSPRLRRAVLITAAVAATVLSLGVALSATPVLLTADAAVVVPVVYLSAVLFGVTVVLAVWAPVVALPLIAATIIAFALLVPQPIADGPLDPSETIALIVLAWTAGQLGLRSRLAVGATVMGLWVLANALLLGLDAPLLMMSVGWWVVGRIAFTWRRLRDRLAARVEELAAERERYAAESVRLERARIARDLHDIVAHCMTVVVIQARAGQQLLTEDAGGGADETWVAISATVAEADADLDALVGVVDLVGGGGADGTGGVGRAGGAATDGGGEALGATGERPLTSELTSELLAELVARAEGSGTRVAVSVWGELDRLPTPLAGLAHRALQECLTNALRYAPGADVRVDLDCVTSLRLTVANAAPERESVTDLGSGHGLEGLRERLAAYGLGVTWGPEAGGGWRVDIGRHP